MPSANLIFIYSQRSSAIFCFLLNVSSAQANLPTYTRTRLILWLCSVATFWGSCWTIAMKYFSLSEPSLRVFCGASVRAKCIPTAQCERGRRSIAFRGVLLHTEEAEWVRRGKLRNECIALERTESLRTVGTQASWNYSRKHICIFRSAWTKYYKHPMLKSLLRPLRRSARVTVSVCV